jgi:T5SS/PEP-CTERM-associated repeat protein
MIERVAVLMIMCVGLCVSITQADISATGDMDPADPATWTDRTNVYIGKTGIGSVTVDDGSDLATRYTYLGYELGSAGAVTVSGVGSTWTHALSLRVGRYGQGAVAITDGGLVEVAQQTEVSAVVGSTGAIHFDNGTLTTGGFMGELSGLSGTGTINTTGLFSNIDLVFDATHGLVQTLTLTGPERNITVNMDMSGSRMIMGAGYSDAGSMHISDGMVVQSSNSGYIGYKPRSTGTVTVSGAGSSWITGGLYVGREGNGVLDITDGGRLQTSGVSIGRETGSTGAMTVSGADSIWSTSSPISVGYSGNGELEVANGGTVSNTNSYLGYVSGSSGVVTVTGVGSTWTNSRNLVVGDLGAGALEITNGAVVSNDEGYIGEHSGSTGVVTVSGTGSTWKNSSTLYVGEGGDGALEITDGGLVKVSKETHVAKETGATGSIHFDNGTLTTLGFLGAVSDLSGTGTINTSGMISDVDLVFDATHASAQTITITGPDRNITVNLAGNTMAPLGAGYGGKGTMLIADGLHKISPVGYIGYKPGSEGVVTVRGTGSRWTNSKSLGMKIGYYGDGTLAITDGGVVNNTKSYIGEYSGSTGAVTVSGENSNWTNSEFVFVGSLGDGTLEITNGGSISNTYSYVGVRPDSNGAVTVSGPGSTWINSSTLHIGFEGSGALEITNGGKVSNTSGGVSTQPGSNGAVTVSGAGSIWSNSSSLSVGSVGDGALTITNGGVVSSTGAAIGLQSGSTGAVSISGAGSTWGSSGLFVGGNGVGVLTIANGGLMEVAGDTYVAREIGSNGVINFDDGTLTTVGFLGAVSDLSGTGTINTTALVSDVDLLFDATHGFVKTFTLEGPERNITVNLNVNADGLVSTGSGFGGEGSMHIADGLAMQSTSGYIGYKSGSSGVVTVSGSGSAWTNSKELYVGKYGDGALEITNNSAVSNTSGRIGAYGGSTGTVTVSGAGSTWTNSSTLYVGEAGDGMLEISDGAAVSNTAGSIGDQAGSTGAVTVSGAGSTWVNSSVLYVGRYGDAALEITNGAVASNTDGYISFTSTLVSAVTVSGAGSTWTNSGMLFVGRHGDGTLVISDGGLVDVGEGTYVAKDVGTTGSIRFDNGTLTTSGFMGAAADLSGTGTIIATCLLTDADLVFDAAHGMKQTLTLTGPDLNITVNMNVDGLAPMGAGFGGEGSMHISDGQAVQSTAGYIGYKSGSSGVVTVSGAGSIWTNSGKLYVGNEGDGAMDIINGGTVSNTNGYVGMRSGSTSTVTVSGVGSTWMNSGTLYVGYDGAGTLDITNAGSVSNNYANIGLQPGFTSTVTVSGTGSTWTNSGTLYVGKVGNGVLEITNGAAVSNAKASIGDRPDSTGAVTVRGAGSTWTNSSSLYVGHYGSGTLEITDAGLVRATGLTINFRGTGTSYVMMATGGMLALAGNADDSLGDFLGLINGSGDIRYWDDSIWDWTDITGATVGEDYTLVYMPTGDLAGYTVLTVNTVPEPATLGMLVVGAGILLRRRRKR